MRRDLILAPLGIPIAAAIVWDAHDFTITQIEPPAPPPPPITAIDSGGWFGAASTPTDPPTLEAVNMERQGFTTAGVATTYEEVIYLGKRVRQAHPSQASFTTDDVAFTDYIYITDSIAGAINNSTIVSPKPELRWAMPARLMTETTCHWEIVAGHRDAKADASGIGRQIACVKVRANDGTTQTDWQTVSATAISSYIDDATSVEVYQGDLDVSGLSGTYWLEAEGYPWFGGAASVAKSEDNETAGAGPRDFTRRYFSKGTAPAFCYVASTGNDSTGSANATAATAKTTPCLTVGGALKKLHDLLGTGANALDGAEIRITDAVSMGSVTFTGSYKQQGGAGVKIIRDPDVVRSVAQVTMSGSFAADFDTPTGPVTEGGLVLNDIAFVHTAGSLVGVSGANLDVQLWNVDYNGSTTAGRSNSHLSLFGVNFTAGFGANLNVSGGDDDRQVRILRGVTIDSASPVLESWVTVGCSFKDPTMSFTNAADRGFFLNNQFLETNSATINVSPANGDTLVGLMIIGNLFEFTGSDSGQTAINICTNSGNSSHTVLHHNTFTGAYQAGRNNLLYDGFDNGGSLQTHDLASVKGNILSQVNYKGDVFNESSVNVGYFPIIHGVGFAGNFIQFLPNAPTTESADYNGPGSVNATSSTTRNDPLFTDYQGSTNVSTTVTAGAGGGDYTLTASSPAKDILAGPLMAFDLAGTSRGTGTQNAGAYA